MLILIAALALFRAAFVGCVRPQDGVFLTTEGDVVNLADLRGTFVLLHFFASWCGECMREAPSLNALYTSVSSKKIKVVGIAIDDHPREAKAFRERFKIEYPVIVDERGKLKGKFGVRSVPTSLVLDPEGVPVSLKDPQGAGKAPRIVGPRDWSAPWIRGELDALLGGP